MKVLSLLLSVLMLYFPKSVTFYADNGQKMRINNLPETIGSLGISYRIVYHQE